MKSDSGREHARRMIGIFGSRGVRGNFEGTRNQVIDGCSRGGGRRLCKEDVRWIVDLNNFLAYGYAVVSKYGVTLFDLLIVITASCYCDLTVACSSRRRRHWLITGYLRSRRYADYITCLPTMAYRACHVSGRRFQLPQPDRSSITDEQMM